MEYLSLSNLLGHSKLDMGSLGKFVSLKQQGSSQFGNSNKLKKNTTFPMFHRLDSTGNSIEGDSNILCNTGDINPLKSVQFMLEYNRMHNKTESTNPMLLKRSQSAPSNCSNTRVLPGCELPSSIYTTFGIGSLKQKTPLNLVKNLSRVNKPLHEMASRIVTKTCEWPTSLKEMPLTPTSCAVTFTLDANSAEAMDETDASATKHLKANSDCDNFVCDNKTVDGVAESVSFSGIVNQAMGDTEPYKAAPFTQSSQDNQGRGETKKKTKSRPSKKKRIRLKLQRQQTPISIKETTTQNPTKMAMSVIFNVTGITNESHKTINDCSPSQTGNAKCGKFSLFISAGDCDTSDSENSDSDDWDSVDDSNQVDETLWNSFFDQSVHIVCGISNSFITPSSCKTASPDPQNELPAAIQEANLRWTRSYANFDESPVNSFPSSRVSFASDMVKVAVLDDLDVDRKGPWEEMARDRKRFADRIHRVQDAIGHVFKTSHRQRVFHKYYQGREISTCS